ncbi:hypothetical protein [Legionella fallonii]|uniref:Dot/Icm T4SS effector n=1 Tax=Legionella fallonii LLAP-10 TaxID=1212491 RepID=A0A098G7B1_9GAMM|nr:hypothetical protein [Legionella fallonii]CEG57395.1 conserved protein of unknown function [Legionella fallonii LLAP-10]
MSFTLVAYETLKARIKESIVTLLRHHKLDPTTLDESLKKLPEERRIQATFLLKTIAYLDPMHPQTDAETTIKMRTLNAAAYYVWEKIGASYGWTSPENSNLFVSLTSSLELGKENKPNDANLADMYSDLEKHLRKGTYNNSRPRRGYLDAQAFKIDGYSVEADILDLRDKLKVLGDGEIRVAQEQEAKKHAKPSSGILAGIFGGGSKTPTKEEPSKASTLTSTI